MIEEHNFEVVEEIQTIKGENLIQVRTLSDRFDNDCIEFSDDKENRYKMKIKEILKFNTDFNGLTFNVVKKRVYKYLEVLK
jgi:hypothetical protein